MKTITLFILLSGLAFGAYACPYCGCGNSNFQIGLLPTFLHAFVGIRYTYSHFSTDSSSQFSRDYFHTTEIWGGYQFKKWQVMAFVPYVSIHKLSDDGVINSTGLGDITLIGNYQLYSKTTLGNEHRASVTNSLWAGGGIKLATGHSVVDVNDPDFTIGDFSGTPGTGSTDILLNVNHALLSGNNGVVTNVAYRINGANAQEYHYGNRLYVNSAFFHSFAVKTIVVRPSAGLNLVTNATNHYQGQDVVYSSGYVLSGVAGVNVQRNKVGLLLNGFMPVKQSIFKGLTQFKERLSVAVTYSF
jgi:hypothetical protein